MRKKKSPKKFNWRRFTKSTFDLVGPVVLKAWIAVGLDRVLDWL